MSFKRLTGRLGSSECSAIESCVFPNGGEVSILAFFVIGCSSNLIPPVIGPASCLQVSEATESFCFLSMQSREEEGSGSSRTFEEKLCFFFFFFAGVYLNLYLRLSRIESAIYEMDWIQINYRQTSKN